MADVRLSATAARSLAVQESYLRSRNPGAADRLLGEVERVLTLLAEHPMAGPQVAGKPYRFFVTRRYRYRLANVVQGERVEVVDILHPRQDLP